MEIYFRFSDGWGAATFANDIACIVQLNLDDATFGPAVDKYGEPEYIAVMPMGGDFPYYGLDAIYPDQGIWLWYDGLDFSFRPGHRLALKRSSPLGGVDFFPPQQLDILLQGSFKLNPKPPSYYLSPWPGFGMSVEEPQW